MKEAAGLAEAAHGAARPVTRPAAEPKGCVPSAGRPLPLYLNQSGCSLCVRTKPGPGGPVCPRAGRTPCAQRPASLGGPLAGGHSGRTPWRFPARTCNQHVSSGKRDKREKSRNKVGKTPVWSLPVSGGGQGARGAGPGLGGGRQAGGGGSSVVRVVLSSALWGVRPHPSPLPTRGRGVSSRDIARCPGGPAAGCSGCRWVHSGPEKTLGKQMPVAVATQEQLLARRLVVRTIFQPTSHQFALPGCWQRNVGPQSPPTGGSR